MSRFKEMQDLVNSLESDFEKFYEGGNKAAGTRVRNGMQAIKNLAQEIRAEITAMKNAAK
ncbi:histone H1 [Algoriphagus lutimaris]|uniref:Histone H1-like protein Hc1 n=1 Tax=Algoriphagus halophilus TaxID=226505 RepID=A0A1N6E3J5_9BACT|nr:MULTISPECIES: histone H1 [Algoriphagus]MBN3518973.1 histone H1 [Algoriphagus lutimaris]SIN77572.1 Histone H1-like protein Hc1 [Algoriphagus halophilus]